MSDKTVADHVHVTNEYDHERAHDSGKQNAYNHASYSAWFAIRLSARILQLLGFILGLLVASGLIKHFGRNDWLDGAVFFSVVGLLSWWRVSVNSAEVIQATINHDHPFKMLLDSRLRFYSHVCRLALLLMGVCLISDVF